ncbi:hypothetical protein RIF29_21849 [Crotalaria pallida]|uniref:Uncharacterized protein n=1 Tax=Crotalaria pallida TaxID=3830 RepID=A0AAN9FC88_CROPI
MIEGIRRFHELPHDVKKEYYSLDFTKKVKFYSNFDLYQSKAANWRDTLFCAMAPESPKPDEFPAACRLERLGINLLELLLDALELKPKHIMNACIE